ncbi:UDP-N-acetylmuramoyl-L-alanyl-D-glutamate--2,6-diaminopimelate ligase [Lentisphaerota bacterium ZTH]|nr:UDP-N-acetylmuramoyl-L-alanyl-D-glutamate--2,6-diaminopimelate ligase [Lentisphaerota bacterium]WET05280.1 UDP-N-acetylmuramoyl-L-alanyl-D-glutamate--2,6-diaminopimelate ligase [Lentisphaerota bacterium ZTH]
MKKLNEFLKYLPEHILESNIVCDHDVPLAACDSRKVIPKTIFCAIEGAVSDGHNYINAAIENGAETIFYTRHDIATPAGINRIRVKDSYYAYALLSEFFFNKPASSFALHGITGTNGKTTCAFLFHKVLSECGIKTGLLSTVEYRYGNKSIPASRTTPEAFELQNHFSGIKAAKCTAAVMEVSSHGLDQHRLGSSKFKTAIFTNLSGDHLDYHLDMERYFKAKAALFQEYLEAGSTAVINVDDTYGERLSRMDLPAHVITFGKNPAADCQIKDLLSNVKGSTCTLDFNGTAYNFETPLIGEYNAYNSIGVFCAAVATGLPPGKVLSVLAAEIPVPGRLESYLAPSGVSFFVDYAHTDDALENVLRNLKNIAPARLITVFGCGGDRDSTKRPRMARAAEKYSDLVIVTSDNPRTENPQSIIEDIMTGFSSRCNVLTDSDRQAAIRLAAAKAEPGDFVVIAGKGHENYQEINGKRHDFDDRQIVKSIFDS